MIVIAVCKLLFLILIATYCNNYQLDHIAIDDDPTVTRKDGVLLKKGTNHLPFQISFSILFLTSYSSSLFSYLFLFIHVGSIGLWKPRYCVLINNLFIVCRSSVKVDVTRQPPPDFKDVINVNDIDEVNSVLNQGTHIMEVLLGNFFKK